MAKLKGVPSWYSGDTSQLKYQNPLPEKVDYAKDFMNFMQSFDNTQNQKQDHINSVRQDILNMPIKKNNEYSDALNQIKNYTPKPLTPLPKPQPQITSQTNIKPLQTTTNNSPLDKFMQDNKLTPQPIKKQEATIEEAKNQPIMGPSYYEDLVSQKKGLSFTERLKQYADAAEQDNERWNSLSEDEQNQILAALKSKDNKNTFWAKQREKADKIDLLGKVENSNNPVAKFTNRLGDVAVNTAFLDNRPVHDTGNKIANFIADLGGTGAGLVFDPEGSGASLAAGTEKLISKPIENGVLKAAGKTTEKELPKLGQYGLKALTSGSEFAGINALNTAANGGSGKDILKSAGEGAIQGAIFGPAMKGIGELTSFGLNKIKGNKVELNKLPLGEAKTEETNTTTPIQNTPLKPQISGKFTVKNTLYDKALENYNNAVQDVQNYFQTNQLTPDEIASIKPKLGIDFDKILSDMDKYKKEGTDIKSIADQNFYKYAAGVKDLPELNKPFPTVSKEVAATTEMPKPQLPFSDKLPDTKAQIVSKTKAEKPSIPQLVNNAYIKGVDNLNRLEKLDKYVEKTTGNKLSPQDSTYMLAMNTRGNDMIARHILTERMVDTQGNNVGESLKSITKQIPRKNLAEFEDYLVNKHAITRMSRGEKVFPDSMQMTPEKSAIKVSEYEKSHPEFKQISQQLYDFNNKLGKTWLVDTGIVKPEVWDKWIKDNPNYVPNNRAFNEMEKSNFSLSKRGFANQANPVKKATGSQRQIISPVESIIEHVDKYVKVAKRNEVMQTLINNISKNPEELSGWAEIVPDKKVTAEDLNGILQKDGIDGLLDTFNKPFDNAFNKPDLTKGNILTGIVNGEKIHVRVNDPQLLDALTNLTPKGQNFVIQSLGQVTRVMKLLTTGLNPVFSLTRNVFRDIPTAYINSKTTNNPLVFSKDLVESVVSVLKNDELYKSFKAVGGGHSSPISADRNLLAETKNDLLPGFSLKKIGQKGIGALEKLNDAVESAPRLSEFKRASKSGDYNGKIKGLFEANDVTVNFNKFGKVAKDVDSVVPYFNAAVQGIDKLRTTFRDNPIQTSVKAFASVTIPTIVLYAINHNDPNYQQVSNYTKDSNFLIPKGDGTFIKIPKPRELGTVFSSGVERVLRQWQDNDPKAFKDFTTTVLDNFAPPTRSIIAPIHDLKSNKNYANTPIVPADLQKLSPKYQYDAQTSEFAKAIGSKLNISPKQIDYLVKSYGGVIGELGIPASNKNTTIGQTLKQKVTVDPVFSNDILNNFYTTKNKLDQNKSDFNFNQTDAGRPSWMGDKTWEREKPKFPQTDLLKTYTDASSQISGYRKQIQGIQNSGNTSTADKLKKIRDLQIKINNVAQITDLNSQITDIQNQVDKIIDSNISYDSKTQKTEPLRAKIKELQAKVKTLSISLK